MSAGSARLRERAVRVMPGGVSSPVRAYAAVGGEPPVIAAAEGAHLVDADGSRYVDFVLAYGPLLAGLKTLEKGKSGEGKWMFRVRMGAPILDAAQIPFQPAEAASPLLRFPLKTYRGELPVTVTSMGNPHCSVFVAGFRNG